MVSPQSPTGYMGIKNYLVAAVMPGKQTDPTSSDLQDPLSGKLYVVPTIWVNENTDTPWMFVGSSGGTASWIKLATAGGADVAGPASATDNAVARFDGITGKLIQNSVMIVSDTGIVTTGNGAVGTPAYSFTSDPDCGMYRVASNTLGFSVNSTLALEIDGATDVKASAGNLIIQGAAKQLQINGGAATDFIGQATLALGTVTVLNTNIAAGDKILVSRQGINGSTALGVFDVAITPATSFTITALKTSDGTTETNDISIVDYVIIRQI